MQYIRRQCGVGIVSCQCFLIEVVHLQFATLISLRQPSVKGGLSQGPREGRYKQWILRAPNALGY